MIENWLKSTINLKSKINLAFPFQYLTIFLQVQK